jgi:hypothetical protein
MKGHENLTGSYFRESKQRAPKIAWQFSLFPLRSPVQYFRALGDFVVQTTVPSESWNRSRSECELERNSASVFLRSFMRRPALC